MVIFKEGMRIVGPGTVYYTNMHTGQEESITGLMVINTERVGQLQVQFVSVITPDHVLEIPDFCLAPKSQYILKEAA